MEYNNESSSTRQNVITPKLVRGITIRSYQMAAIILGRDEADLFAQCQYWRNKMKNRRDRYDDFDGKRMCYFYKTYRQFQEQDFPTWSISKIRRKLDFLVRLGLIRKKACNKKRYDNTLSWAVDLDVWNELLHSSFRSRVRIKYMDLTPQVLELETLCSQPDDTFTLQGIPCTPAPLLPRRSINPATFQNKPRNSEIPTVQNEQFHLFKMNIPLFKMNSSICSK
jgi:hypothetical protein